jgi:flagellar basal-body rod protein FlgC
MTDVLERIMTNAASGMSAQSERLNLIASNLANAGSVGSSDKTTYRAQYPVFTEVTQAVEGLSDADQPIGGVRVTGVVTGKAPLEKRYEPDNPLADGDGFVHLSDVDPIKQMTDMIAASKEYEANVQVMNTTRDLLVRSMEVIRNKQGG